MGMEFNLGNKSDRTGETIAFQRLNISSSWDSLDVQSVNQHVT